MFAVIDCIIDWSIGSKTSELYVLERTRQRFFIPDGKTPYLRGGRGGGSSHGKGKAGFRDDAAQTPPNGNQFCI